MDRQHFFIKLIPPRPSFAMDMTDVERELMNRHIVYWRELTEQRTAIIFGPVMDPKGGYGMGVIEATDINQAQSIVNNDPTLMSNTGFGIEIYPMRVGMVRKG